MSDEASPACRAEPYFGQPSFGFVFASCVAAIKQTETWGKKLLRGRKTVLKFHSFIRSSVRPSVCPFGAFNGRPNAPDALGTLVTGRRRVLYAFGATSVRAALRGASAVLCRRKISRRKRSAIA